MITCYVRYVLDMQQLEAFAEYGRLWIRLINKLGGTHHGYFLPSQDPRALNHGRFSFRRSDRKGRRTSEWPSSAFQTGTPTSAIGATREIMRSVDVPRHLRTRPSASSATNAAS